MAQAPLNVALGNTQVVLARHVGAPEGDVSMSDVCLEISCEGPAKHEDIVTPGTGETLLLNEFSRTCAQLWLVHHGRHFACTKQRRDHGRTDTQWRLKGSMQAVRHRQKLATDLLLEAAARDDQDENAKTSRNTIVGVTRSRLMRGAGQHKGPSATKTLLNFRNATRTRMKAKDQVQMWVGMPKAAPRKRTCHAMSPLVSAAKKWIRKTPTNHPSLGVPKVRGSGRKGLLRRQPVPQRKPLLYEAVVRSRLGLPLPPMPHRRVPAPIHRLPPPPQLSVHFPVQHHLRSWWLTIMASTRA